MPTNAEADREWFRNEIEVCENVISKIKAIDWLSQEARAKALRPVEETLASHRDSLAQIEKSDQPAGNQPAGK